MGSEEYPKVAEYFVVAGLTESAQVLEEDLAFPNASHKLSDHRRDPITDIAVIDKTLEETCPEGFTCIELTPGGFPADLNHGGLTAHSMFLCYRRGKDKPPLIDLGVCYEGLEVVRRGISVLYTTPSGKPANVNNKSGMGSHPIYFTYGRAKDTAPQNSLVVTDICIILTNKGERPPYAFCQIEKNLNKGLIGSSVYLCYKKSMRQVDQISYKAGLIGRYPQEDVGSFPLPATVPLFCLPMGATVESWSSQRQHPLPTFSTFVLTTETSDKVFGAVVSFYESYSEEKLSDTERKKLGLLQDDGTRSRIAKTLHTNKAICLLSRWPMFTAFRDFLTYLYKMTVSPIAHSVPVERHIGHFIHNVPFPSSQRPRVQYQMSPFHLTILTRPQITPIPLSGASFLALLDDLGPDNTIALLVLALTEHKIVIHSLRPAEITRVAEALITLLFPFKWQCAYVPLCPIEMGYVLEAPCPFIVGVDSRYFDLYEPPSDVVCVNLDTNNITMMEEKKHISWKLLPKKPAKFLRSTLQRYFKEVKECPREELVGVSVGVDLDTSHAERHRRLELAIQEAVLKVMTVLMKGYRQYLLPITVAPSAGTTDPSSLFNIQEFVKSRDKSSQRFFNSLTGTQLFSSFIDERSLTSYIGGEGAAGRSSSLVFFDECIDRIGTDLESAKLIEADESLKSEHTVMIMAPDETGLPPGVGYQYTTFPKLQEELFMVDDPDAEQDQKQDKVGRKRRKSDSITFGRRTKQEVRNMQKVSGQHHKDSKLWAQLLLSHAYGAWFACLPAFVLECRHKDAALRTAHNALHSLKEKRCFPLPDETYYRMLLHLCLVHNKPALAVRVYHFIRNSGIQPSAITYGLYNKAVLEGTWPTSNRDGYMLWQKLRNVLLATRQFRYVLRRRSSTTSLEGSSDADTVSQTSSGDAQFAASDIPVLPQPLQPIPAPIEAKEDNLKKVTPPKPEDDRSSTGGQSDHGYNSMPKDLVRRGSPLKKMKPLDVATENAKGKDESAPAKRSDSGSTEATDNTASSTDIDGSPGHIDFQRSLSNRSVQPPCTLDIPPLNGQTGAENHFPELGLKSDDTLVNGENGQQLNGLADQIKQDETSHRPRASPVSSGLYRKPGRLRSIVKSSSSYCGGSCCEGEEFSSQESPDIPDDVFVPTNSFNLHAHHNGTNHASDVAVDRLDNQVFATCNFSSSINAEMVKSMSPKSKNLKFSHNTPDSLVSSPNGDQTKQLMPKFIETHYPTPLIQVTDYNTPTSTDQSARIASTGLKPDAATMPLLSPAIADDNVFAERTSETLRANQDGVSLNVEASKPLIKDDTNFLSPEHKPSGTSHVTSPTSGSPATPEIANSFGSDIKFFSSLSDADQLRYQELCGRRPSSVDPESVDKFRSTRHGSLMLTPGAARGRSSTSIYTGGGGISPLVGQNSSQGSSNPNTPLTRSNFDNLTADDLMLAGGSPTHSLLTVRSVSGSIITNKSCSPNRLLSSSGSPVHRRSARKMAGSNNLVMKDGLPMLSSTPLRPLVEPVGLETVVGCVQDADKTTEKDKDLHFDPLLHLSSTTYSEKSSLPSSKQNAVREDISHLAQDPLSPGCNEFFSSEPFHPDSSGDAKPPLSSKSNSLSRHLVKEIEDYLRDDTLVRCSSDATVLEEQKKRMQNSDEKLNSDANESKFHRKGSLPSSSPKVPRKGSSLSLQRSITYHEDESSSKQGWFGTGSKFNSLLKATTVGMASKAKKVATNLAKDLNDTMQASIAYYTPEKVKGSASDLRGSQEDILSKSSSDFSSSMKQLLRGQDHYSSQSSLRSIESIHSTQESRSTQEDKVTRRTRRRNKKTQNLGRPHSVPQAEPNPSFRVPPYLTTSHLSIPGLNNEQPSDLNLTSSMTSLNVKDTYLVEVTISSCSRCHECESLVYDEEIMAGWIADDSNLNTHCPFCNSFFVPFLNIEITDYRHMERRLSNEKIKPSFQEVGVGGDDNLLDPHDGMSPRLFSSSNPDVAQGDAHPKDPSSQPSSPVDILTASSPDPQLLPSPLKPDQLQPMLPASDDPMAPVSVQNGEHSTTSTESSATEILPHGKENEETLKPSSPLPMPDNTSESQSIGTMESQSTETNNVSSPRVLEPVAVPYLSSLVLRKELESLLENEGTVVLSSPGFVDHHPIIYWNLVWYFRRLNLHSNLYNLLLQSQLVRTGADGLAVVNNQSQTTKSNVIIHVMWDNLKLHDGAEKPPLYCVWHQLINQATNEEFAYSASFLDSIRDGIIQDDVRGPLVAVLNELNVQQGVRRSAYREILYLIIVALGKLSIDFVSFDRGYIRAYNALTLGELALAKTCDQPPTNHAIYCRHLFGELDLYK